MCFHRDSHVESLYTLLSWILSTQTIRTQVQNRRTPLWEHWSLFKESNGGWVQQFSYVTLLWVLHESCHRPCIIHELFITKTFFRDTKAKILQFILINGKRSYECREVLCTVGVFRKIHQSQFVTLLQKLGRIILGESWTWLLFMYSWKMRNRLFCFLVFFLVKNYCNVEISD